MAAVLAHWGLAYAGLCEDVALAGSPERSLQRAAVRADDGQVYVLERVAPGRRLVKARIAETLAFLERQGLRRINPYLRCASGAYLANEGSDLWQISRFVQGTPLDRPGYLHDGWRGEALAGFLGDLRALAVHVPGYLDAEPFDLGRFIIHLVKRTHAHHPQVLERLRPIVVTLECELLPTLWHQPLAFCHGDVHPMNVIWAPHDIAAVIDWEFAGEKPEGYDLALLLGCVGVEDPDALTGALATGLLDGLQGVGYLAARGWALLPELTLATRLVWLAEWLRARDAEMVELELDYIALLHAQLDALRSAWGVDANVGRA
ncbi:MAG: aminoglycoside phosphotransferase family protein [Chloroflexi bacterium]|nr:aminoglycoside phosphotransferase family protein [Chloroflexota bacterium]